MAPRADMLQHLEAGADAESNSNFTSAFPSSRRGSMSSSASSIAPQDLTGRPSQPSRTTTTSSSTSSVSSSSSLSTPFQHSTRLTPSPVDVLSRQYPPPPPEVNLDEMLARPPQKWSLGHYVKNAREPRQRTLDKEQQEREFANTKRELLAAKEQLRQMATARR
ncbi:hypothetical protein VTK73DRAFT_950 [Phialemonium thermophilum]|uniref:Uncharacterized protein n=1 Tax=Phialemonium thermophilum TaxID=223376 RepID=A0ABR3XBW4_9PEZI